MGGWTATTVDRSEELCRIFGVARDEFAPTFEGYLERVHPDDRKRQRTTIETAVSARACRSNSKSVSFVLMEPFGCSTVRARGLHNIWRAPGAPGRHFQDVTERKQADNQLRRGEEQFQLVAGAADDAIWDWDLTSGNIWWNRGITRSYRLSSGGRRRRWRLVGRVRIHPDHRDTVTAGIRAVMDAGGQFWSAEYRFRRADGSYADIFDRGFVIYDGTSRPIRMIGAIANISERKRSIEILEQRVTTRTSELRKKNSGSWNTKSINAEACRGAAAGQKRRVESLCVHGLSRPQGSAAWYCRLCCGTGSTAPRGLSERALHCLKQILTATHNLDRLIEDLLHYARLDAETTSVAPVNLAQMVEAILRDRQTTILAQGAEVTVNLGVTKRPHVGARPVSGVDESDRQCAQVPPSSPPVLDSHRQPRARRRVSARDC